MPYCSSGGHVDATAQAAEGARAAGIETVVMRVSETVPEAAARTGRMAAS